MSSLTRSSISPRLPVTSAADSAPACPPTIDAILRVMSLRALSIAAVSRSLAAAG
jgi:hypothetical protein